MGQLFGNCRYPRIIAEEVEAEMEEMVVALEPLLPPPIGLSCCKTLLDNQALYLILIFFFLY